MLDGFVAVLLFNAHFLRRWRRVYWTGFPLAFACVAVAWTTGCLPSSVYHRSSSVALSVASAVASTILTDLLQTAVHVLSHACNSASHRVHHTHRHPTPEDAFHTGATDALLQLLLPIFVAVHLTRPDRTALILYGCFYSSHLLYIHGTPRRIDRILDACGFVTPAYHRQHHRDPTSNMSTILKWM